MAENDDPVVNGYDAFYEAWGRSPSLRRIWRDHATGADYPEALAHISFVPLATLRSLKDALRLDADELLVDLACGAGGPGLWVANETGARLVGIDRSPVAVRRATEAAARHGMEGRAAFRQGTFDATGIETGTAHSVMSIDALQYAPDKAAAIAEMARILRPGGRLALIVFELDAARVEGLGLWNDPVGDYRPLLEANGFEIESYEQLPDWQQRVDGAFGAVLEQLDVLTDELGEPAATALALEASVTVQVQPYRGHVLAVAVRAH